MENEISIIKNIIIYMALVLVFIIIFACMTYTGENYDGPKAYGILKDSLALGIAILTPFVALQIYNGWVAQHKSTMNEKLTIKYRDKIKQLLLLAQINPQTLKHEELSNIKKNLAETFVEIEFLIDHLYPHRSESKSMLDGLRILSKNIQDYQTKLVATYNAIQNNDFNALNSELSNVHQDIHDFCQNYKPLKIDP